jgi:hypothetical protein
MISIYLKHVLEAQRKAHSIHGTTNQNSVGKSQRKATKTLGIIMRVFLSFWTPFYLQQSPTALIPLLVTLPHQFCL